MVAGSLPAIDIAQIYSNHAVELAKRWTGSLVEDHALISALVSSDCEIANEFEDEDDVDQLMRLNRGKNVLRILLAISLDDDAGAKRGFEFFRWTEERLDVAARVRCINILRRKLEAVVCRRLGEEEGRRVLAERRAKRSGER